MKITDTVKIGGIMYKVIRTPSLCKDNINVDGEICYDMGTIEIKDTVECDDYKDFVFIHEILHGIFDFMSIEQNEELVIKLSKGLHMVIKDNPEIFKEV